MSTNLPVLAQTDALAVQQVKEWGEILSGWETKNNYQIASPDGQVLYYAGETGGGVGAFFMRSFLKNRRPFTIQVVDTQGQAAMTLNRPWTWFFARLEVTDASGRFVGAVQQRFAFFARRYTIEDASGNELVELHGPFFKPWTFQMKVGDQEVGKISKQWSGLLKEAFSDADNFGVEFGPQMDGDARLLCLGATFLIDFVHFENTGN